MGILSIAGVMALGAIKHGLFVKQSEVHGMSQRGGAIVSHIRISDKEIQSSLIPNSGANAIISVEPLEVLKQLPYLNKGGIIISNTEPYDKKIFPDIEKVLDEIKKIPGSILINADKLAIESRNKKSANMVLLGAATA
ncbi:MAG: 2-oxoacid:acceptor oxidoreductase family protein [Saprospiraceae bacterium]